MGKLWAIIGWTLAEPLNRSAGVLTNYLTRNYLRLGMMYPDLQLFDCGSISKSLITFHYNVTLQFPESRNLL